MQTVETDEAETQAESYRRLGMVKLGDHGFGLDPLTNDQEAELREALDAIPLTPKRVAAELYARSRRTHPNVTLEELEAAVTEANAAGIHGQLVAAVEAQAARKARETAAA